MMYAHIINIVFWTVGVGISLPLVTSCGKENEKITVDKSLLSSDSIPENIKKVAQVLADNDSVAFASMVSYPLQRPYPLYDIKDSTLMADYYSVMIDDSLRRAVAESKPNDWEEQGWKGWSLKHGNYIWIDEAVYDVPYLSQREKNMRAELIRRDLESLPEELRAGWMPEWCLIDPEDGYVYRIDVDSATIADKSNSNINTVYRLAVYKNSKNLRENPDNIFRGFRNEEGSIQHITYLFKDSDSLDKSDDNQIIIEPWSSESGDPIMYHRKKSRKMRKTYWIDLLKDSIK